MRTQRRRRLTPLAGLAGVAVLGSMGAIGVTVVGHAAGSGHECHTCDAEYWVLDLGGGHTADVVEGRPYGFSAGDAMGTYIWHNDLGWHLRTTDPTATPWELYKGQVTVNTGANGHFSHIQGFQLDKQDTLTQVSATQATWRFTTLNHLDGIDFRVTSKSVTFEILKSPRHDEDIHIGPNRYVPASSTFTFIQVPGTGAALSATAAFKSSSGASPAGAGAAPRLVRHARLARRHHGL